MKKYITKQSGIKGAGKGLFTKDFFKKDEVIGLAHVDDQPASEIGRNHNHNEKNPTAYSKKINNKRFIYASKDLNPGEEITTNYRMQPELEQPEDFMRKGGSVLRLPNKKNSKGYSRSLSATNKLFTQNFLFAKPKSRKNKVFDPNSKYYAEGGALLTKKVTCKKCGCEWDAEDGGKDITTCHKCGGQGLVHAQDGGESECPEGYVIYNGQCVEWQEPEVIETDENTGYNAATGQISQDTRPGSIQNNGWWTEHEKYHHLQNLGGGASTFGFLGQRPNNFVASDQAIDNYYDRRNTELEAQTDAMIKADPNLQFIPRNKLQEYTEGFPGADALMYQDPNTEEGEARVREEQYEKDGKSMFPKKQYGGNKDAMTGMMKARLAYANEFGNPAAERMINLPDNPYQFDNGDIGSHYMASIDNYAVPQIQDENGVLQLGDYGPKSNEAIRFDSDEDANYFAENYKDVSPGFIEVDLDEDEIEEYRRGGYIVEEIDNFQKGGISKVSSNSSDNTRVNYQKPLVKSFNRSNNLESFYKKEREKDLQKQKDAIAYHDKTQKVKQNQSFGEFINNDVLGIPTLEEQTKQLANDKKLLKKELKPYFETEKEIDQFINEQYSRPIASAENNYNDGSIQMMYPEKYFIGPGGGMIGNIKNLGKNTFNLGKKVLSNPYVSGGLNAYFGAEGIKEFSNPNSLTRKSMSRVYDNPTESNIGDAAFDVGMNSLNFIGLPFGKAIKGSKNLGKFLGTESGVLSNTYKLNPWANKIDPFLLIENPEALYRGIGKSGIDDLLQSKLLRSNNRTSFPEPYFVKGSPPGAYGQGYIAEVKNEPSIFKDFATGNKEIFTTKPINLENPNLKIYNSTSEGYRELSKTTGLPLKETPHWRKGYSEVPKQLPGSPNVDFSKYLTQEEAIVARAERLISQKNKPGWNEQLTPELEQRLSTAVERHNPASDYPGEKLGSNTMGRTATEVSKDANLSGIPLNEANKARIAAHETGHYYSNSPAEGAEWLKPFNLNKLENYKTRTYLRGKGRSTNYANEIRERAAQLKDYIAQKNGIPLNQDFKITQVQLDDAIKNYVKDTGLDNTMSKMLGALKDKKGLLKTMNKYALGTVPIIIGAETLQQKKQGGTSNNYVELDLTPEEIKDLITQGYVIEELN